LIATPSGSRQSSESWGSLKEEAGTGGRRRTVLAGAVGNLLEWYDFGLFGFFAPVISQLFFPAEDKLAGLLGTFGVFAVGFLMRPLGGIFFGYMGDRLGRKLALEFSVALMAIPTALIGLLPTYAQIGLAAPVLLTAIRILQGLSVGGEYIGSMSFLVEHADTDRRALQGSWSGVSVVCGSLLGSGVAALLTGCLTHEQMLTWGWRLPFLAGLIIGGIGLWLRRGVDESPRFLETQKTGNLAKNPIADVLRENRAALAATFGLTLLGSVPFYLAFVWLPTWFTSINTPHLAGTWALGSNTIALVVLMLLTPVTAILSDRVGRKPMILAAAVPLAVFSYPIFLWMRAGTFASALVAGLAFAISIASFSGCMAAAMAELFPTRTRYSGVAMGYNVGMAIFGGTAPLIATALIKLTGDVASPGLYIAGCAAVAGVSCLFMKDRRGEPLD
jgi:MFS transporter, MHS family, proline/betaine transporter